MLALSRVVKRFANGTQALSGLSFSVEDGAGYKNPVRSTVPDFEGRVNAGDRGGDIVARGAGRKVGAHHQAQLVLEAGRD